MKLKAAVPVSKHDKPIGNLHFAFCHNGGAWAFPLCGAQLNRYQTYELNDATLPTLYEFERCLCCKARVQIMRKAAEKALGIEDE